MKLLLKASSRLRRNLSLFAITLATLFGLTFANQIEMVTLGVLSDAGSEFFNSTASKSDGEVQTEPLEKVQEGIKLARSKAETPFTRIILQLKKHLHFEHNLKGFLTLLLGVAMLKALLLFFSRYTTQVLSIRISRDLRQQYFSHIQTLPMSFYQKYNIGTLAARVTGDANQIAASINSFINNYLHAPVTIIATLLFCFYLSWKLSMVIFFGLPLIILPVVFVTRKVKKITRQLQRNQERFTSVLIDFLAGIQTIKVFGMEPFSMKKYNEQNRQMARLETKTAKYDLMTRPVLHTVTTFCLASVIIVGVHILQMKMSELVVFVGLLYHFYEPVKKFAEENANIQKGEVAAERMFEVLNLKPKIVDTETAKPLKQFDELIEFDHVWFKYENEWVLRDLSFSVRKGETVAILGGTGVGKSTIVQLLPRLYEIQKGEIRIDGKPIHHYTQKSLRGMISFVPQKPFLFYDTIAANIAYGNPFSSDEIEAAAKKAHAHEFIDVLPNQYDTMLAETGKNLSGGQQQRLAIARALVKKAPIMILDEATSSLDALSEKNIKMAIKELHGEMTQIVIAHRLSTIEYADRIIYLEQGKPAAEGTKDELLANNPSFRLMWETYFNLEEEPALPV